MATLRFEPGARSSARTWEAVKRARGLTRSSPPGAVEQLVGEAGGRRVDQVVEEVDGDLLLLPEDRRWSDVQGGQRHLRGAVDRGAVGGGGGLWGEAGGREQPADDPPARAVAPVREVVESGLGEVRLELLDAKDLRCRASRRRARRPAAELRLDRARGGHGGGPGDSGHEARADARRDLRWRGHAITSVALAPFPRRAAASSGAPIRSAMWSPTRSAFAIAVSAGFTALDEGKKLVSTTYRLSTSWALQLTSSADVRGSVPKRTVPHWCATPASGMR